MEFEHGEMLEPMSPSAEYLRSSALSLTIIAVMEFEYPIDDSNFISLIISLFLPINPRFSSIMVTRKNGVRKWKKVEVNLKDHVKYPKFPSNMSDEYYDDCFTEYMTKIAAEELPSNRPLWEIHIVKYPTKNAAGNLIFKLHHSLGDGYSLMGALLSCLQRLDNPDLPLTLPSRKSTASPCSRGGVYGIFGNINPIGLINTAYDFASTVCKSSLIEDDKSPIRSGEDGVEFRPIVTCTTTFSIDKITRMKNILKVTLNDVVTGIIIYGTRLYMKKISQDEAAGEAKCTALVLLNTRAIGGYKSLKDMVKPDAEMPWGNRFAFLQVPLQPLPASKQQNPLDFVTTANKIIKRQKNSAAVYLTGQFLNLIRKIKGPETTARYIHGTLKNTSMAISNLIGPVEPMALSHQPIKGLYFAVAGPPQSLSVTLVSYAGNLRIAMTVEKGFIDERKFKSCIEYAYDTMFKAALESSSTTITSK